MIVLKSLIFGWFSPNRCMLRFLPVSVSFIMVCVLFIPGILLFPVQAEVLTQSVKKTDSQIDSLTPVLDHAALKAAIAHRIREIRGAKEERYKQFSPDLVEIEETLPVNIRGIAFFAVKLKLHSLAAEGVDEVITLIVDKTGTLQISGVHDLASGTNLMQDELKQLQHVDVRDLPPDFGKEIFTGDGAHTVTAVSDPFCPHCRKGWEYFKLHQDRIKTFRLAHFPLNASSEAACMVIAYAHHQQFKVFDIVDFAYTQLHSAPDPQKILEQFMDAFPELAKKWGQNPASASAHMTQTFEADVRKERNAAQALGISSTPVFFVNDTFIRGFHTQKMDKAMQ